MSGWQNQQYQQQQACCYEQPTNCYEQPTNNGSTFVLIVVLFILLIIVGSALI